MKTFLVALLILVVGTGTASAECAWVLWEENPPQSNHWRLGSKPHFTVFDKQDVCTAAATTLLNALHRFNSDARLGKRKEMAVPNFVCLPDTVDPRGPKGK